MNQFLGQIHIYTGDGKGKTTCALGLIMRAIGAGKKCAIIFFDKGGVHYSERATLDRLGVSWFAFGRDRIDPVTKRFDFSITEEDRVQGRAALEKAEELYKQNFDLLVLDECCTSIFTKIISEESALELINKKPAHLELVLTGRHATPKLIEQADLVSEIHLVKHYLQNGVEAREGIDF